MRSLPRAPKRHEELIPISLRLYPIISASSYLASTLGDTVDVCGVALLVVREEERFFVATPLGTADERSVRGQRFL